jgi:micrococcal nuclease
MVNQELLKQGYGIANLNYTDGKFDRALLNSQDYARIMEKGIWRIENE